MTLSVWLVVFFFFQAEDGIRDDLVTGVQTCALPISLFAEDQTATRRDFGAGHCIPNAGVGSPCDRDVAGIVGAISGEIAAVQPLHAVVKEGSNTASSSGPTRLTFDACTLSLCEQFS